MQLQHLAILGPGLLGGSLLMAARRHNLAGRYTVWARRQDAVSQVESLHLADLASTDLAAVVDGAELVVICTPVETIPELASKALPLLSGNVVVTDVGSTKSKICHELDSIFSAADACFVGSHPMAGSEESGLQAASPDLYSGAVALITPTANTNESALKLVRQLWLTLGSKVLEFSPQEHDTIVAAISHLPHLCAALLMHVAANSHQQAVQCLGNGFLDTTRVASGSPGLWRQIIANNKEPILHSLTQLDTHLATLCELIESENWQAVEDFLGKAKATRDNFVA